MDSYTDTGPSEALVIDRQGHNAHADGADLLQEAQEDAWALARVAARCGAVRDEVDEAQRLASWRSEVAEALHGEWPNTFDSNFAACVIDVVLEHLGDLFTIARREVRLTRD